MMLIWLIWISRVNTVVMMQQLSGKLRVETRYLHQLDPYRLPETNKSHDPFALSFLDLAQVAARTER